MSQSALYSEMQAKRANLTLERLGLSSWEEGEVKALQKKVGAEPVDGWFGPKSIEAWKTWAREHDAKPVADPSKYQAGGALDAGCAIISGIAYKPPEGCRIVNFLEPGGIPAQMDDTSERKYQVTQFVLHRGAERVGHIDRGNYARATERILDARGLSTSFSMDVDGTIYQHFDVGTRRGRHATHHNIQSDSMDIGGPFVQTTPRVAGQEPLTLKMAIGRENDHKPPLARGYGEVHCWTMPEAQIKALALFLPWWCKLRGIPLTACSDWRTFRLGGLGTKDPVTNVKGILAHTNISGPGQRVDGILPLHHLKEMGAVTGIQWRSGADFFKT